MMYDIPLIASWIIFLVPGILLLIASPIVIYKKIGRANKGIKALTDERLNALIDEELADKKMLFYYYAIAGITITIIGFLLVLIFSGKLTFPKF